MNRYSGILVSILMLSSACGGAASGSTPAGDGAPTADNAPAASGAPGTRMGMRGARYCEILLAYRSGFKLRIEVYNTIGLNDCPQEQWEKVDLDKAQADYKAEKAIRNGPRYWLIDGFVSSSLADKTVKDLGGIDMHLGGVIEMSLSEAKEMESRYTKRTVARKTTYVLEPGKMVHELVNPEGQIFVMQSYSVQFAPQSEETLPNLGSQLELPAGWTYRARKLPEELRVATVDGVATVVTDDFNNTYQLSQQ